MTTPLRRGNGLTAPDYLRVARPREDVAEAALDALRRTRIAAFVLPVGDGSRPEAGARLELWVDARELDDVTTVLASVGRHIGQGAAGLGLIGAGTDPDELDELGEFGELDRSLGGDPRVGRRGVPGEAGTADDPLGELGTRNPTPSARPYPAPARPQPTPALPPSDPVPGGHGPGTADDPLAFDAPEPFDDLDGVDEVDDPDDHFRPDEPESLRTLSRITVWALLILSVGVVALALSGLAPGLFGVYAALTSLLGTAAVLVGIGMLVTRLRDGRRDDGEGNDGGPNGDGAIL